MQYLEGLLQQKVIDVSKFISHTIKPNSEELLLAYDGLMNKKDVYTGVIIDWRDLTICRVFSAIAVIRMHNMVPLYILCIGN